MRAKSGQVTSDNYEQCVLINEALHNIEEREEVEVVSWQDALILPCSDSHIIDGSRVMHLQDKLALSIQNSHSMGSIS